MIGDEYQPLRVAVSDEIRRRIIAGVLPQGERIREEELAAELGVSRNPVREALQTLTHEGFVEIEPRRGARVMVLSDERAGHLFEVREVLEGLVAALAAKRRTLRQLGEIERVTSAGLDAVPSGELAALPALNSRFHALLVDAAANPLLAEIHTDLTNVIQWMYTRRLLQRGQWSWDEHAAITRAVADQDADRAAELARAHIRNARDAYFS
jgi:DNA-binding GntR family transcriptional regulator